MKNKNMYGRLSAGAVLLWLLIGWHTVTAADTDYPFDNEQSLTAERLVEAVLARNPDIRAMQATWASTAARVEQASALDDPMFSYTVAPQTFGQSDMDFGHKISVSQRLPWPGKRDLRGGAARFESDAARERVEQIRLKLIHAAKMAFADWYFVQAAIRVNEINASLLQELLNIAQIKYAAGRASKQDALRAEVERTLLEHRDIVLARRKREVLVTLNTLLQRQPDLPLPPAQDLPKLAQLPTVEELRAIALQRHPRLRVLAARRQASRQREGLAARDFYPDITLNAAYNTLWNQDEKRLTAGAMINIPLSAKRHAAKDEAQAKTLRLDAEHQATLAQVMGEVQRAYDYVWESTHIITLYRDRLLPLAEENLQAAQSDYEAGSGNFLDLISVEKNLMQTRLQLEQALADYQRRLAGLEHTVGGSEALHSAYSGSDES